MKKTLVAVAALAAVTGAMAEVTIGGLVDAAVYTTALTNSSSVKSTTNGIGPRQNGADELFFSVSEDLGNGIKASAFMGFNAATAEGDTNPSHRLGYASLSGAFGTVDIGTQWKPGFFSALFLDTTGLTAASGAGLVGPGNLVSYTNDSITYTAPALIEGLGIQLQKGYGEVANSSASNTFGYRVDYRTGGLYLTYAAGTSVLAASGTFTGSAIGSTTGDTLYTAGASETGTSVKSSIYGASYDLGMVKFTAGKASSTAGSVAQNSSNIFGVSAPVGPVVLALISTSGSQTTSGNVNTSIKGTRIAAFYNLTKRTQLYAHNGTSTAGTTRKTVENALGIKHSF